LKAPVAGELDPTDIVETSTEAATEATAAEAAEAPATLIEVWPPLMTISESAWPLPLPGSTSRDGVVGEELLKREELEDEQPGEEEGVKESLLDDEKTMADEELQEVQGEHETNSVSDIGSPKMVGAHLRPVPVAELESEDSDPDTMRV